MSTGPTSQKRRGCGNTPRLCWDHPAMRSDATAGVESTGTTTGEQFTEHIEPADQGGEPFLRCTGCSREILASIGADRLTHADGCPNARR